MVMVVLHHGGVLEMMQHSGVLASLHPLCQRYMRSATVLISLETPPELE